MQSEMHSPNCEPSYAAAAGVAAAWCDMLLLDHSVCSKICYRLDMVMPRYTNYIIMSRT